MSKIVFRNYNKKSIKALIKEVGVERYFAALKDANMWENKPLTLESFYLEFDPKTEFIHLYFRYPARIVRKVLPVHGFWAVPEKGWEKKRVE